LKQVEKTTVVPKYHFKKVKTLDFRKMVKFVSDLNQNLFGSCSDTNQKEHANQDSDPDPNKVSLDTQHCFPAQCSGGAKVYLYRVTDPHQDSESNCFHIY